jgi:hypothetical protein
MTATPFVKAGYRLLPPEDFVRTGPVDHADWNYRFPLGWISRRRLAVARRGEKYTAAPLVWVNKSERATLRLTAGPKGMTLTDEGRVEWDVPKDFDKPFATITLAATAADGTTTTLTAFPPVSGPVK